MFFRKKLSPNEIIDQLENQKTTELKIDNFSTDIRTRHHNTLLLQAIAWNRLEAAQCLIDLDTDKTALDIKDCWPTCQNTPLLLAAKIDASALLKKLLYSGANPNSKDYRNFTALHFACLLRNDSSIQLLLDFKANPAIPDDFGNFPIDYYLMPITKYDLEYRYGVKDQLLFHVPDLDQHFFATQKRCLTALRWFIPHIIVNNHWGCDKQLGPNLKYTIYETAQYYINIRQPVSDIQSYQEMMQCFVRQRKSVRHDIAQQLSTKNQDVAYNLLDPRDFVPAKAVQKLDSNLWIELQELEPGSRPRTFGP